MNSSSLLFLTGAKKHHGAAAQHQSQPGLVERDTMGVHGGLLALSERDHFPHHRLQHSDGRGPHRECLLGFCHHAAQGDAKRYQHLHCQPVLF